MKSQNIRKAKMQPVRPPVGIYNAPLPAAPNPERHGDKVGRSAPAHQEEAPPAYEESPPAYEEAPPAYEESPPGYDEPQPPGGAPAALFEMSPRGAADGVVRRPEDLGDMPPPPPLEDMPPPTRARSAALMPAIARPPQQRMEPANPIAAAEWSLEMGMHMGLSMHVSRCVKHFVDGDAGNRKARAALEQDMRSVISEIAKLDNQDVRLGAYKKLIKGLMKPPEAHPNDSARLVSKIVKECLRPLIDNEHEPAQEPDRLQSLFNTLVNYQSAHR